MLRRYLIACAGLATTVGLTQKANATTEPAPIYDGRSVGMGGTGVAYTHNAASIYQNVAGMHEIKKFALTLDLSTLYVTMKDPVSGEDSKPPFIPLFLLGGAVRIHDRIVIGAAAYAIGGFGAEYDGIPGTTEPPIERPRKISLGTLEFSPLAASFALTDNFSLGLGYRITHSIQSQEIGTPGGPVKSDLSGTNFLGFQAGAYWHPTESVKLGLVYRSKVTTDLEGDTEVTGAPMKFKTKSSFASPHTVKLGSAFEVVPQKLMFALDFRYLLHKEANKKIVINTEGFPPDRARQEIPLNWKNTFAAALGAEYWVTERVPLRTGYQVLSTATPKENATQFFLPPGLLHSFHLGAGYKLESLDIDLGGYYQFGGSDNDGVFAPGNPVPVVLPGRYEGSAISASLSVTYHK